MKFSALRTLATLLRVIAVLEGVIGLVLVGKAASADGSTLVFLAGASGVAFKVLVTYAVAEAIGVFLAIEENTRRPAEATATTAKASALLADEDEPEPEERPAAKKQEQRFVDCPSCGKRTEADSRFCQKCGKPLAG